MALVEKLINRVVDTLAVLTHRKPRQRKGALIIGAGHGPSLLARQLSRESLPVTIFDCDEVSVTPMVNPSMVELFRGDPTDINTLKHAGAEGAAVVLVSTKSDELNLVICDLVEMCFNPARLIVIVNDKANLDEFEVLGYEVMSLARAALTLLPNDAEICQQLQEPDRDQMLGEVLVCSPVVIGRQLSELPLDSCEVIELKRQGQAIPMTESLQLGDTVTLFGIVTAIESACTQLNPQC